MITLLPPLADVRHAARDTGLLVRLRWRLVRGVGPRLLVLIGLAVLVGVLAAASNVGRAIWILAGAGTSTTAGQFAANYVMALERGELGVVGAAALGAAVAASLFSPFTGAASLSLASPDDLTGIRPARLHAFFDSVVTTSISTIGFLQLFGLTVVASLLTLDGTGTVALLLAWLVWPCLILLTVALVWGIELLHRVTVRTLRRAAGTGIVVTAAAAIVAVQAEWSPLFGLGGAFAYTLREIAHGDFGRAGLALGLCVASSAGLFLLGLALCQAALCRPARTSTLRRVTHRRTLAVRPQLALLQILVRQMARTVEVRRPILAVVILGIPAVWVSGGDRLVMTTLVLATPLAVALAWGVNAFGVLGSAMPWLASQPHLLRWLLWMVTGIQVMVVAVLAILCWAPPWVAGVVDSRDIASLGAGLAVSTAVTTRSAVAKAVWRPYLTRLGEGGDVIVPPLAATNYALRFALWGGQFGVLVLAQSDPALQVGLVCAALVWSSARFAVLLGQWRSREVQAYVVATVAAS